jgi:septal ring factor EnvC (AmiA/AmiB activator)
MVVLAAGLADARAAQDLDTRRSDTARELEAIRQQIALGDKRRSELSEEIGKLEKDRASINKALIDASASSRKLQADIEASERRLDELNGQQAEIRASLSSRRAVLAEVLGSLMRMGAHPPPAILVKPEDALSAVRSAIALGAVVPEIRAETEVLASELAELERIGRDIGIERSSLSVALSRQAEDEERMALILDEKKKLTAEARQELAEQGKAAAELAARETDLSALIGKIESEIAAVKEAVLAASKAEEERAAREQEMLKNARTEPPADFSDTGRIAPAMAFEKAQGLLPRPVEGVEINAFGKVDALGKPSPGLSIATSANARVASPADGWVAYAGPFRSYGQLLILNAGNGYHVVLAGMERVDVQLGQFVLAGEPVAAMGSQRIASMEAIGVESARPVLYVEFRKDGKSIDPSPWWADTTSKRVADDS